MKFAYIFLFLVSVSFSAKAQQNMSDYSFVVIPEQFDFLNEKDKYSLNSMTQFYFEKYGFHAFLANKVPNVKRCDGLYAEVVETKSFLNTRLQIIVRDCNAFEIYKSDLGNSKIKEYKTAYQDALREAFNSLARQNVKQKDMQLYDFEETTEDRTLPQNSQKIIKTLGKVENSVLVQPSSPAQNMSGALLPNNKFSNYKKGSENFLLRKTDEGYSLYLETKKAEDGLMLVGKIISISDMLRFIDTQGDSYNASFDAGSNLSINYKGEVTTYMAAN